ncbi:MAG: hypothetical protein ACRDGE_11185 [Candidatus Limnocylindria bacterium]
MGDDRDLERILSRDLGRVGLPARERWRPAGRRRPLLQTFGMAAVVAAILLVAVAAGLALEQRRALVGEPDESIPPAPSGAAPQSPTATPTASPSRTPRPLALDPDYGWTVRIPPAIVEVKVRRETDPVAIQTLSASDVVPSPDGRWLAYWTPTGVRRELRVAPTSGGPERTVLGLPDDEVGNEIAWSTDGSGLAVQVDSTSFRGGVNPSPTYTSIRTVDLETGEVREVVRRSETHLSPLGWIRDRGLIPAYTGRDLGGIRTYHLLTELGDMSSSVLSDDNCRRGTVARLDPSGGMVLSVHPQHCSDSSRQLPPSVIRLWPVDDPSAMREIELPGQMPLDARFRPGTTDVVIASVGGQTLRVELVTEHSRRIVSTVSVAAGIGVGFAPILFRPGEGDVLLVVYPEQIDRSGATYKGRLIDIATGATIDVDLGPDAPSESVLLTGP